MSEVVLRGVSWLGRQPQDVTVARGVIVDVSPARRGKGVDCDGLVALPGLVDLHTHLREPGKEQAETVESGTRAAARGGFTTVCAMANTTPVADGPQVVDRVRDLGDAAGHAEVRPVGAVTVGLEGRRLADIDGMAAGRARVRMFSDDGHCVADPALMREALRATRRVGGVLAQHAQEPALTRGAQLNEGTVSRELGLPGWPAVAEETIIARDCLLAHHEDAPLHVCHVSTAGSVEVLRWAKAQGWPVTAEVTPHHLLLTDERARTGDPVFKVNPPLRADSDVRALREALADGTIDAVATDHAPHTPQQKRQSWCDAPMGMLGLETALAVVIDTMVVPGLLGWDDVADRMAVRPGKIARLGSATTTRLHRGAKATFCLVDPAGSWTVRSEQSTSRSRNTPFAGLSFSSRVVATFWRGRLTHGDVPGLAGQTLAPEGRR
jgi:dihydroorotase